MELCFLSCYVGQNTPTVFVTSLFRFFFAFSLFFFFLRIPSLTSLSLSWPLLLLFSPPSSFHDPLPAIMSNKRSHAPLKPPKGHSSPSSSSPLQRPPYASNTAQSPSSLPSSSSQTSWSQVASVTVRLRPPKSHLFFASSLFHSFALSLSSLTTNSLEFLLSF